MLVLLKGSAIEAGPWTVVVWLGLSKGGRVVEMSWNGGVGLALSWAPVRKCWRELEKAGESWRKRGVQSLADKGAQKSGQAGAQKRVDQSCRGYGGMHMRGRFEGMGRSGKCIVLFLVAG